MYSGVGGEPSLGVLMRRFLLIASFLICGQAWGQAQFLPDVTTPITPPLNEQINILRRAINENSAAISILDADRVPWSNLGVIADGVTDNTAALNALPAGIPITANCAAGSFIRYNQTWVLKSNLNIKFQPGCRMVSYLAGFGTYAMTQADNYTPLNNVTLDGITISKDAQRDTERILLAWIDNFRLLNWTVNPPNGGLMILRGSCQEIAYGRFTTGQLTPGAPGIRHVGNLPKVACPQQIADVWVHDNNFISGDGAYQSCQPLETSLWTNVSSDDLLWENNTGRGNWFALIGNDRVDAFNVYTCNNIVYRNNVGGGTEGGYLVTSNGAPVTNVSVANQLIDAAGAVSNNGAIQIRGNIDPGRPGVFSNITFDSVSVRNTHAVAVGVSVPSGGSLDGLVIRNGTFDTPSSTTSGGSWQPPFLLSGGGNITLQNNVIRGGHAGAGASVYVGVDDAASDARTISRFTFVDNVLDNLPAASSALYLRNVDGAVVAGNKFRKAAGAATTTGIRLSPSYALPTSGTGPGTTNATISGNVVNDMATPITWTCNGGTTNVASYNMGAADRTCAPAPVLTACGTSPTITGNDGAGEVTMGTGSPTGCVITFNVAYATAPYCTVTWQSTPLASQSYSVAAAAVTLVQTATSSNKVNYTCEARS
jgi:hypothetical protein